MRQTPCRQSLCGEFYWSKGRESGKGKEKEKSKGAQSTRGKSKKERETDMQR